MKLFDLHCVLSMEIFSEIRRFAGNKVLPLKAIGSTLAALASAGWRDQESAGETVAHIILRAYQSRTMTELETIEILEPVLRSVPHAMLIKNTAGVTPSDVMLVSQGTLGLE